MGFYLTEPMTGTAAESRTATRRSRTRRLPAWLRATHRPAGRHAPHSRGAKTRIGVPTGKAILSTKYLDKETGLYYYGYRYYCPEIGHWASRDPIEENGFRTSTGRRYPLRQVNYYSFARNSPACFIDLLGLVKAQSTPDGHVHCNAECKKEITGCDAWPIGSRLCCIEHEAVHLGQLTDARSSFCKGTKDCCPDKNSDANGADLPGTTEAQTECPAYKASLDCCMKAWNAGGLTAQQQCDVYKCIRASRDKRGKIGLDCPGHENDPDPRPPPDCDISG